MPEGRQIAAPGWSLFRPGRPVHGLAEVPATVQPRLHARRNSASGFWH